MAELIGDSPEITLKRYCQSDEKTKRNAVDRVSNFVLRGIQGLGKSDEEQFVIPLGPIN